MKKGLVLVFAAMPRNVIDVQRGKKQSLLEGTIKMVAIPLVSLLGRYISSSYRVFMFLPVVLILSLHPNAGAHAQSESETSLIFYSTLKGVC